MKYRFSPEYQFISKLDKTYSADEIKNEPMLYQSDIGFALFNGGNITKDILDSLCKIVYLPQDGYNVIIDTKVTMLKKGWYAKLITKSQWLSVNKSSRATLTYKNGDSYERKENRKNDKSSFKRIAPQSGINV